MHADDVKLIEQGKFDFNKVKLEYNPNWESIYCKQPEGLYALERLRLAVGDINDALEVRFRLKDDEIPDPELIPQMIYDYEIRKIMAITENLRIIGCGDLSVEIATAYAVELFPADLVYFLYEDEDALDEYYSHCGATMNAIFPFLGELCTRYVYQFFDLPKTEDMFWCWNVFEYLNDNLYAFCKEPNRADCIAGYKENIENANGIYAQMFLKHVKACDTEFYDELVIRGELKRACIFKQIEVQEHIDNRLETFKREDYDYLEAYLRGQPDKMQELLEEERLMQENFAVQCFICDNYKNFARVNYEKIICERHATPFYGG
jgi:hypothetical protein